MKNKEQQQSMHLKRFERMLNPLHNSGFSDIGSSYRSGNPNGILYVGIKGLGTDFSFYKNREARNIPFFKKKLEVHAFAELELDSPVPDIAGIETKFIDKGKRGRMKVVSLKLKPVGISCFAGNAIYMGKRTTDFAFERPHSCFNKLIMKVFYCEGTMITPVEHSCDSLFIWPEWPEEPANDSFLTKLKLERNQSDVYVLLTNGHGQYINASSYHWNVNRPQSLAWYINKYVHGVNIHSSNALFEITIEGLINMKRRFAPQLFIHAQQHFFSTALSEIKSQKRKITHWMWFVFPQMIFKYPSEMSLIYSLDIELMFQYRKNEYLMKNMEEMLQALLEESCPPRAYEVFGRDALKFKNSLWFFIHFDIEFWDLRADFSLPEIIELFKKVYSKYFGEEKKIEENSMAQDKFESFNLRHFNILVEHYKIDCSLNDFLRSRNYF